MIEDQEKIANVSLQQRADQMAKLQKVTDHIVLLQRENRLMADALADIRELVEGEADVDDGRPNLAMRVQVVVKLALREEP